jgi:hypothetical protein
MTTPTGSSDQIAVTIGGSYNKHVDRIVASAAEFRAAGATVLRPTSDEQVDSANGVVRLAGDPTDPREIQQTQLAAIDRSQLYYVENPGGYVGAQATGEVFHAKAKDVIVFCKEEPYEQAVALRIDGVGTPAQALAYVQEQIG